MIFDTPGNFNTSGTLPDEAQAITRGVVVEAESDGLERITATNAAKGGRATTCPASRLASAPFWSPPQLRPGQTSAIGAFDQDPHNLVALGVEINSANLAPVQPDPANDDGRLIPGNKIIVIGGDETRTVTGSVTIETPNATVHVSANGEITLTGTSIKLAAPLTTIQGDFEVKGRGTIDGVEIAVVGAEDTRNDTLRNSGQ